MRQVAGPDRRAALAEAKVDADLDVLTLEMRGDRRFVIALDRQPVARDLRRRRSGSTSLSRSAGSPALPTAMTTRPQLASSPAMAVLTSGELAMLERDAVRAVVALRALHVDADELRRAFAVADDELRELQAQIGQRGAKGVGAGVIVDRVSGALPALPVAKASTVSLVEVSLSTVMHEKLSRVGVGQHARCRNAGSTAASVKI